MKMKTWLWWAVVCVLTTVVITADTNVNIAAQDHAIHSHTQATKAGASSMHVQANSQQLHGHALAFPPSSSAYFSQVLKTKSLRLLIIGGMNSALPLETTPHVMSYIQHLQKWLETSPQLKHHVKTELSYIQTTPTNIKITKLKERLEQDLQKDILGTDTKKWPNILLLEHGQDCNELFPINCVYFIEILLQRIFALYDVHQLPRPDVMFVDVMRVEKYYHLGKKWLTMELPTEIKACQRNKTMQAAVDGEAGPHHRKDKGIDEKAMHDRAKAFHISEEVDYNNRGSWFGMNLVEFGRFYRYAVLSTPDAWYRSFVHFFLSHDLCEAWPLMDDGHVLTAKGHEALYHVVKHGLEVLLQSAAHLQTAAESTSAVKEIKSAPNAKMTVTSPIYCTDVKFAPIWVYNETKEWHNFPPAPNRLTHDYYKPTQEEIRRGFVTTPSESWGKRIAEEKSLRMIALGGSNTAFDDNYVDGFRSMLLNASANPFAEYINISDSYVENGGIPGWGPAVTKLPFEKALPPSKWPNVILMEYMVNCNDGWLCIQGIERVRTYYERLYLQHNVTMPDIMFLELFRAGLEIGPEPGSNSSILLPEHNANYTKELIDAAKEPYYHYNNRGARFTTELAEYARFSRFPIISFTDAFFPSAVRFIDSHQSGTIWPFARDNVHIDGGEGVWYAVHLMSNFFKQRIHHHAMKLESGGVAHTERAPSALAVLEDSLRILGDFIYEGGDVVTMHRLWGPSITMNEEFRHVALESSNFTITSLQRHDDGKHRCMGSTTKGGVIRIRIEAHPVYVVKFPIEDRPNLRFTLMLGVLHSWNRTYIGSLKCNIYKASMIVPNSKYERASDAPVATQIIKAYEYNGKPIRDSTPRNVLITKNLTTGPHVMECENLEEGKLGCITHFGIYSN